MYELKRITDPVELVEAATARRPAGPDFPKADAQRAAVLVVEASSFSDPGPDFTRWQLLDADGAEVAATVIPGY
jgi:hypothetical protein